MINIGKVKCYCNEDITQIENYEIAINDDTQTWDCHHRRETDDGLSVKQLIELGLYWSRPADELIFLTKYEHHSLHHMYNQTGMNGKHHSENSKQIMSESHKGVPQSEEAKRKNREAHKGRRPSNLDAILEHQKLYGSPNKGKHRVYDNKELKIYHYE